MSEEVLKQIEEQYRRTFLSNVNGDKAAQWEAMVSVLTDVPRLIQEIRRLRQLGKGEQ